MRNISPSGKTLFLFLWIIVFILYFPTAQAGFVSDYTGWLDTVRNHSFWEHINRTHFVKSLYQFTQLMTYIFYKLFGVNKWLWHLLFVTLHAVNGYMLYYLFKKIFEDAAIKNAAMIAMAGGILFCITPHASEVVVWEPAYHYLQALLLMLAVLISVRKYLVEPRPRYLWISVGLFFLSAFSLELFFITPLLVLLLGFFYYKMQKADSSRFKKLVIYSFLPMIIIFVLRMLTFRVLYHDWVSRIGSETLNQSVTGYLSKALYYVYHVFFFGRFFPQELREKAYLHLSSTKALWLSGIVFLAVCALILIFFRRMGPKSRTACLLFGFCLLSLGIVLPSWFANMFLITLDRYTYIFNAFGLMLLSLLISFLPGRYFRAGAWMAFAAISVFFTVKVNRYWSQSADIVQKLITQFPEPGNKMLVLLNLPENLMGAPMLGTNRQSEFKLLHNLLIPGKLNGKVYDAESYNMLTKDDGAHVTVTSDSTATITLNQWGTWWIYQAQGATNYENEDYRVNILDVGHRYEIILKKNPADYVLLYQVGDRWKQVDWSKKNVDQE